MAHDQPELLNLLFGEYQRTLAEQDLPVGVPVAVIDFIKFANDYLKTNRPTSVEYCGAGIAVRLQNGITVQVGPPGEEVQQVDGWMPIGRPMQGARLPNANDVQITKGTLGKP